MNRRKILFSFIGIFLGVFICGEMYTLNVYAKDVEEHIWSEWSIKEPATRQKSGIQCRECVNCGEEEKKTINRIETVKLSEFLFTYDGDVKKPEVIVKDINGDIVSL